jgi:hypothetical protein
VSSPIPASAQSTSPDAHAGPDRQKREVVDAAGNSQPTLAERGKVDVVLERDAETELLAHIVAERAPFEAGYVRRPPQRAARGFDDSRDADDDAVDELAGNVARIGQRVVQRDDRVQHSLGTGTAELDVLARANLPTEIADRPAQETGAEVESEHERGVRHGFEEHGAVARPARIGHRFANQARVE